MGVTTPFPSPDAIARAERLTRERFVYDGETLEDALAPGSARRRALDAALTEVQAGNKQPSIEWRREFSLLLGLERLLSEEEPHLADKTVLSAHQVDALSGTLTALLAEVQRIEVQRSANGNTSTNGSGSANGAGSVTVPEHVVAEPDLTATPAAANGDDGAELDLDLDDDDPADDDEPVNGDAPVDEDEEPQDWQDEEDVDEEPVEEQPEDPNAAKRFWFEHATGAGKTVAALGFVEASRTGGVLILTHRRNL